MGGRDRRCATMASNNESLFISLEGGDGTGKTTLARDLCRRLEAAGHAVLPVHEPGSTPLALLLRDWLKKDRDGEEAMGVNTELLLFLAARSDLVSNVVKPALQQAGRIVVADRYADSTLAYQGYGRGMSLEVLRVLNGIATSNLDPDLTFFLDCPPETALSRVAESRSGTGGGAPTHRGGTRFENESMEFHHRVHQGYKELAAQEPDRWVVIDATRSATRVSEDIWTHVLRRLPGS